jgi:hypothetical protein
MRGSEAVRRGDFWALMFFVVAIANFFLYFVIGWTVNIIIQVSILSRCWFNPDHATESHSEIPP